MIIVSLLCGLTSQLIALYFYEASSLDGFIAYLIGIIIGILLYKDAKGTR